MQEIVRHWSAKELSPSHENVGERGPSENRATLGNARKHHRYLQNIVMIVKDSKFVSRQNHSDSAISAPEHFMPGLRFIPLEDMSASIQPEVFD